MHIINRKRFSIRIVLPQSSTTPIFSTLIRRKILLNKGGGKKNEITLLTVFYLVVRIERDDENKEA